MKHKFQIEVVRTYFVNDIIDVKAVTIDEAYGLALEKANNTDYTGKLQYDDTEIIGEREIKN